MILSHGEMHGKSNWYICEVDILAATKLTILSQTYAAGRASNMKLLIVVSEFMVKSRLENT